MSGISDLRDTFFLECEDLLEATAEGLRQLQDDPADVDTVNSVFRAVHSIKGGAGAFKLDTLVEFAHSMETLMDEVRGGRLEVTPDLMRTLFHAADHLADLVECARDGGEADAERGARILADLSAALPDGGEAGDVAEDFDFAPMTLDLGLDLGSDPAPAGFRIRFAPRPDMFQNGNDAFLMIRELAEMGDLEVTLDSAALPALDALDPTGAYLSWSMDLTTDQPEAAVREVFDFVEGACELEIEPIAGEAPEREAGGDAGGGRGGGAGGNGPEGGGPAGGSDDSEPAPAAAPAAAAPPEPPQPPRPAAPPAAPAPGGQPGQAAQAARAGQTIRVALDRVDRLINVVGELVIHQAMLTQAVEELDLPQGSDVSIGLDELKQLSREMQESVMAIRAQPVKPLFQRMFRIVREAGEATGKSVRLVTEGDTTEVDKTVFEKLSDPLTHMIRNAVDHGLEPPEKRRDAGKVEEGTVTLSAGHRSGRVVITISDDGGGINREKVRQIAIDKGLIPAEAELSLGDIDNLLFLPGFSTASEVSSLSGRGVGMDVVKSAILELGGTVSITSTPGKGTTFTISLPLTLAVLDGMVVDVAQQKMVVPITAIIETLRPAKSDVQALGIDDYVIHVRGNYIPVVDVGHVLGFRDPCSRLTDKVVLLVETDGDARAALLVDDIQDHRQVVIKSLEENFGRVPGVAAATVFGDGQVALIIDTNALVDRGQNRGAPRADDPREQEVRHA